MAHYLKIPGVTGVIGPNCVRFKAPDWIHLGGLLFVYYIVCFNSEVAFHNYSSAVAAMSKKGHNHEETFLF